MRGHGGSGDANVRRLLMGLSRSFAGMQIHRARIVECVGWERTAPARDSGSGVVMVGHDGIGVVELVGEEHGS